VASPVVSWARAPSGTVFDQSIYAPVGGLPVATGARAARTSGATAGGASASRQAAHPLRIQ